LDMIRYAAEVSYDGSKFYGWQRQRGLPSVQGAIEESLFLLNGKECVTVTGAGRTDAGAHAAAQVCSFKMAREWGERELMLALNSNLPDGVTVMRTARVRQDFNARYDAVSREYMYFIWNASSIYPHIKPFTCWLKRGNYDWSLASLACAYLEGEHDFKNFCRAGNSYGRTVRQLYSVKLRRKGNLIRLHVVGNGFLTNMVRIIAGCLESVAAKEHDPEWIGELLTAGRSRSDGGKTLTSSGLFLWKINYNPPLWN